MFQRFQTNLILCNFVKIEMEKKKVFVMLKYLEMRVLRCRTELTLCLPVAIVHRDLGAFRGCPLESVALCIQRLGTRIRD